MKAQDPGIRWFQSESGRRCGSAFEHSNEAACFGPAFFGEGEGFVLGMEKRSIHQTRNGRGDMDEAGAAAFLDEVVESAA